jgi:hypothetical protein
MRFSMIPLVVLALMALLVSLFQSRRVLHPKILTLQHQLAVYQQSGPRPHPHPTDWLLWIWLSCLWSGWQEAMVLAQPRTVMAWQRKRFRDYSIILQRLRRARIRSGTVDLKIAALVLSHGATLLSRNLADFRRTPDLQVEDWAA